MASLNALNYLNVAAYVINAGVVFGIDYTGLPSNPQVSAQFPTLITPAGFAFAIWSIIFMSQAVYVIVQLLPPYRNTSLVQEGVGYNYVGACVAQATWAVLFAFEMIPLSAVAMVAILFFLARIVQNQHSIRTKSDSEATYEPVQSGVLDFWFLVFPFAIHGAWIVVAAFVNISIVLVFYGASANLQFGLAIVSLILLVLAGAEALLKTDEPNYTAAVVFAWALFAIYFELKNPPQSIAAAFSIGKLSVVKLGSAGVAASLLVATLARAVVDMTITNRPQGDRSERLMLSPN